MKRYLTEFIGTYFLVLTIGLVVLTGTPLAPLAIGATLMVMVYMGGHVSGAHYNPAVSLALALRGTFARADLLPYWAAQILGALVASLTVFAVMGETFAPGASPDAAGWKALLIEILFTFALALVVLNVATHEKTAGNSYYGLAIGFTVAAGAMAGGPISGGAFNPAVGIGPTLIHGMMGRGSFDDLWLYLVGPLVGGALAAGVFALQRREA